MNLGILLKSIVIFIIQTILAEVIAPNYSSVDYLTPDELRYMKACYAGEITMVNNWFGKFLEKMRELDLLDRSLVILVADHGHQLGEHNLIGKVPRGLYPELMDIPLFIRHPDEFKKGERVSSYVYNHDIVPTILHFLGIESPIRTDGNELWSLIDVEKEGRSYATSRFNGYVWTEDKEFAYISNYSRDEEYLYNLKKDTNQTQNIVEENKDIADAMFQRILNDAGGKLIDHNANMTKKIEEWYKMEIMGKAHVI